ncbi:hypothetical protein mgb1_024 [Bacillus phage MG-B1]|uniref:Uncharacterized protein n=1 Tax=Bacillus phage MG-B1 TaxID=1309583 RepID=M4W9Q2_9CAUD|nr:hypothetical protein mgb1_024 [Bacillus phage MG-B1]AGI10613.1 hypothetical protein mgb1_024 [Bacillus phage MG-B1]
MKYLVTFRDCWSGKIHEEECSTLESLQIEMFRYFRNDCVCTSLKCL